MTTAVQQSQQKVSFNLAGLATFAKKNATEVFILGCGIIGALKSPYWGGAAMAFASIFPTMVSIEEDRLKRSFFRLGLLLLGGFCAIHVSLGVFNPRQDARAKDMADSILSGKNFIEQRIEGSDWIGSWGRPATRIFVAEAMSRNTDNTRVILQVYEDAGRSTPEPYNWEKREDRQYLGIGPIGFVKLTRPDGSTFWERRAVRSTKQGLQIDD